MSGVGIKENENIETKVYPNPASEQVFAEFNSLQENATVKIFDVLGKLVKGATFTDARKYILVPVHELPKGMYMMRIKTGGSSITKKFIKD